MPGFWRADGSYSDGSSDVQLTGSNVPKTQPIPTYRAGGSITVDTVVNAASVAAAGLVEFNLTPTTEKEIWVAIIIDQQPWTLQSSTLFYAGSDGGANNYYPKRSAQATTHTSVAPCTSLHLGLNVDTVYGLTAPTTMQEARQHKIPYLSTLKGRLSNGSASLATVTIKLIRVWGD